LPPKVLGFPLKGDFFKERKFVILSKNEVGVNVDYHFGGYGEK
jgi:hypothetical protein